MAIIWNKVTWYSKAIAVGLFVLISLAGYCFGVETGYLKGYIDGAQTAVMAPATTGAAGASSYYANVATWQASQNTTGGFSIAYPIDFPTNEYDQRNPSANWSLDNPNGTTGNLFFTLGIPKVFEPQTNFADATLTVGESANPADVQKCLVPGQNSGPVSYATTTINGVNFLVYHSADAGAGNLYDTTSYRTVHNGQCYAIEYTLHSSQIANYPAQYDLKPFDPAPLTNVLNRIVGTFRFN